MICAIWLAVRLLESVLLFGLEDTLPVLELLVDERLDSNSEMIEDARELEVVSVPVVVVADHEEILFGGHRPWRKAPPGPKCSTSS